MHPLEVWQAMVLGIVEGITEYLPVSSTGHLILASALMGIDDPARKQAIDDFDIVIQGGAILAVLGLYWPSVARMLRGLVGRDGGGLRLLINLVIAFIPSAVLGLLAEEWIEARLFRTGPVLFALAVGGLYMMAMDLWSQGRLGKAGWRRRRKCDSATVRRCDSEDDTQHQGFKAKTHGIREMSIYDVSPAQALMIGLLQCVSLWPGTSRSMMTITGGMLCGLKPRQAAEFSFLLGLPTLCAATLYKLLKNLKEAHDTHSPNLFDTLGWGACIVGILVAALAAMAAVKWLVAFLTRHGLMGFGWYRLGLCAVLLALSWSGIVSISGDGQVERATRTVPPIGEILKQPPRPKPAPTEPLPEPR